MKYSFTYPISAAQIDARYRLTVDGLLTFHEDTVARYFTLLNVAAFDIQKKDRTWVISEIGLEMPEPPSMWSESIEMTVWISEMSSMRVWVDFAARETGSGKAVARGNSCWSLISMTERKLVPCEGYIPESELAAGPDAAPHRRRVAVKASEVPVCSLSHTVNIIDLDFNGHANNRRYVQIALASLGPDFIQGHRPDSLHIRFIRESRSGETITAETYPTEDPASFLGQIKNGSGQEICRIVSHWVEREAVADIAEVNLVRNPR